MREKKLFLTLITIIIGLAAAASARAEISCPTASPQGVGCASEPSQTYYCSGGCRDDMVSSGFCPSNNYDITLPTPNCKTYVNGGIDTCGVCKDCEDNYYLCKAAGYPEYTCIYNDPANHCDTLTETGSICNAGACASCVNGYTLCDATDTCIATQSCEPWETFNACTNACEGAAPTLKLNYNSVNTSNYIIQSSSPVLSIPPSGLVGIGTTAPDALLHVAPSSGNYSILAALSSLAPYRLGNVDDPVIDTDAATKYYVDNSLSLAEGFWGGDVASNIWSLNSGNVGIGTTGPTSPLHVVNSNASTPTIRITNNAASGIIFPMFLETPNMGNNSTLAFTIGKSASTNNRVSFAYNHIADGSALNRYSVSFFGADNLLNVLASGNVGIGTTDPGQQLEITNSFRLPSTTDATTGVIYKGSDRFIHNFTPTGAFNTNTFIGLQSGNFTGTYASANDYSRNTAVGYQTLMALTTGHSNTAIGSVAGRGITSGAFNNVIGGGAGQNINTGIQNNLQGWYAGAEITSGSANVVIGESAMRYNQTGGGNLAVGYRTLFGVSGNSYTNNTAIGSNAGYNITTGSNNIFLGYKTGESATTATKNIVIGYDIDTPAIDSVNTLNIGNLIFAIGLDGVNTALSTGFVGIGTTAPSSLLHVVPASGNYSILAGDTVLTPYRIGNVDEPVLDTDATTKFYVDNLVSVSSGALATFVGVTASTYNGNQGGNPGYAYADSLCAAGAGAMVDSHVCTVEEILYSVRSGVSMPSNIIFWIFSGPPGYTASANDCEGRTTAAETSRGAVWDTNTSYPQGRGMLTLCNNSNIFGCCK